MDLKKLKGRIKLINEIFLGEMNILYATSKSYMNSSGSVANTVQKKGMILPFTPLAMSFDSVNYYVDMPSVRFYSFHIRFIMEASDINQN